MMQTAQKSLFATLLVGCLIHCCQPLIGYAEPPSFLSMFQKKQKLDDTSLELEAEHGPWMILATTLSGPEAKEKATQLAQEIRSTMRLPSFVLEKSFNNSGVLGQTDQVINELDGSQTQYRKWMQYANPTQERVFAVLVGEFTSTEDPRIQDTLQRIRTAQPRTLAIKGQSRPQTESVESKDNKNWLVQKYRQLVWSRTDRESNLEKGPMGAAFVTRNPLLPDDFFEAPKVDDFVEKLNRESWIEHSLLDCPGRFTVRVASFTGFAVTDFGNGSKTGQVNQASDELDKAAKKAHKLTMALRAKGEPAFEFHDRFGSYVTIGSFNSLGNVVGGQFQYNPEMIQIIRKWCGYRMVERKIARTGQVTRTQSLNELENIPFDIEGKPIPVPRPETSKLYRGSLLGGR